MRKSRNRIVKNTEMVKCKIDTSKNAKIQNWKVESITQHLIYIYKQQILFLFIWFNIEDFYNSNNILIFKFGWRIMTKLFRLSNAAFSTLYFLLCIFGYSHFWICLFLHFPIPLYLYLWTLLFLYFRILLFYFMHYPFINKICLKLLFYVILIIKPYAWLWRSGLWRTPSPGRRGAPAKRTSDRS